MTKLNVIVDNINKDTFKEKSNFFSYRGQTIGQNDYGRCICDYYDKAEIKLIIMFRIVKALNAKFNNNYVMKQLEMIKK